MKILYITSQAVSPNAQGDFQENIILHGLRSVLGEHVIDLPRKKVMYGDFTEVPRNKLHGLGFTLYDGNLQDLDYNQRLITSDTEISAIIYGITDAYGITDYPEVNQLCSNVWYIDGHDTPDIKKKPCFKRELFSEEDGVFPTGFGIPIEKIRALNFNKTQLCQGTAPAEAFFKPEVMRHLVDYYAFTWRQEKEYYDDMQRSWFGLTCKKGGWDSLRHYEILAAGSCLLFREYDKKPPLCAPQNLPCFSYGSVEELEHLMHTLVVDDKPTNEYIEMVLAQREWLLNHGTTTARGLEVLNVIKGSLNG